MQRVRGLDGLRALAVMGVLLYHADLASVPGGFLGVDVFFVLSGYLITSLLLREWRGSGRLDFKRFYAARARRLLPGLAGLLIGTSAAALIRAPDAVATLRRQFVPSLAYYLNWSSIYAHTSYFEQTGRPPLLLHLWSLAVEEQFYLLWPLIVLLVLRRRGGRSPRTAVRNVALAGAALSAAWMWMLSVRHGFPVPNDPSRAYYGTDTHASGLMLGSALACVWPLGAMPRLLPRGRLLFDLVGAAALGWVLWGFHSTSEFSSRLYRGGFFMYSAVVAVAVAVIAHPECRLGRVLAVQPLRWIGERSYGIYLWHWPVFQLTRPSSDIGLTGTANLLVRLAITGVLAELSWRYLEMPIRHGALGRLARAVRPYRAQRAVGPHRKLVSASVMCAVASVLVLSALTIDRPRASANPLGIDTPPPVVTPPPSPAAAPPGTRQTRVTTPRPEASPTPASALSPPKPTVRATPAAPPPVTASTVTAWGDSVMLGAGYALRTVFPHLYLDAVVGRQATNLPSGLAALRQAGDLGPTVVIHVGDNGLFLPSTLNGALNALSDRRRVVLVTIRVPRRWQDPVNGLLRSVAAGHHNVVIADWNAASAGHPEYFVRDGVHLTYAGCVAFADVIARAAR